MFGVHIEKGISDWQIVQQEGGFGQVSILGSFAVPEAAENVGVLTSVPKVRIMCENDNYPVIPWSVCDYTYTREPFEGTFSCILNVPGGGPYRLETGLDTVSTRAGLRWLFRGDVRLHLGVGNLFVIAGQSNAAGYAQDSIYDPPSMDVHLYRNRRCWDLASHPMNESTFTESEVKTDITSEFGEPNTEMGVSGLSPYLAFGKRFSQLSHMPVGLIATALGGSPISRWSADGGLYNNMLSRLNDCGGKCAGILWYQGCADTDQMDQAFAYKENYYSLIERTRKDLGYSVPFFTCQLNRYAEGLYDHAWGMVREAQRLSARELELVYVLPTIQCSLGDGIHNNAVSNVALGERLARLCGSILCKTASYAAPDIERAVLVENEALAVTFRNVTQGFVLAGKKAEPYGFTLEDKAGNVPVRRVYSCTEKEDRLYLELERPICGDGYLSFAWEALPAFLLPLDKVTHLPPLAFYKVPVEDECKNTLQHV